MLKIDICCFLHSILLSFNANKINHLNPHLNLVPSATTRNFKKCFVFLNLYKTDQPQWKFYLIARTTAR